MQVEVLNCQNNMQKEDNLLFCFLIKPGITPNLLFWEMNPGQVQFFRNSWCDDFQFLSIEVLWLLLLHVLELEVGHFVEPVAGELQGSLITPGSPPAL